MSINLIESEHRTQRRFGGTGVSVAVHACIISLAVYSSAGAVEQHSKPEVYVDIFPPTPTRTAPAPASPTRRVASPDPRRAPGPPRAPISIPTVIPTTLPPIDASYPSAGDSMLFGAASDDSGTPGIGLVRDGSDSGEPLFAVQVEKPAMPRSGNPSPKYPPLLESSRVEGAVLVQFVVDTLGVADMSTFKVLDSTNDLFAASTRATVSKWRFFPAEARGHKVEQIVQLPLRFVAPHQSTTTR